MPTPEEYPKLADYWQAFEEPARESLRESLGEALFVLLRDPLENALRTSFYCGSEAIISALIHHQEVVGPNITDLFNALADESAEYLAKNHHADKGAPDDQA